MKVVFLGAGGQLGQAFQSICPEQTFLGRMQCDASNPSQVRAMLAEHKPDAVVNCSAYTNVDAAEDDVDAAYSVNQKAVLVLCNACYDAGVFLVHFSTDYVFDGSAKAPISEDSPTSPLGVYGMSKRGGEKYLASIDRWLLVRTSWVLGRYGKNFLKSIIRACQAGKPLRVVSDQMGGPTPASLLARNIWDVLPGFVSGFYKPGTYHVTGTPGTWFDVAKVIAQEYSEITGEAVEVSSCLTSEWPTKAERPMYSVLANDKWQELTASTPISWEDEVRTIVREMVS